MNAWDDSFTEEIPGVQRVPVKEQASVLVLCTVYV